ncbi:aldo/keto reductase, partial [Bacillus sp. S34]|nr:aldo/keto reductase [Bacillus sp. S34]
TAVADSKGVTLPQLSLAWLLAEKDYIVPIPGSKNPDRVAANLAAASITLTRDDLRSIEEIIPSGAVGPRFTY